MQKCREVFWGGAGVKFFWVYFMSGNFKKKRKNLKKNWDDKGRQALFAAPWRYFLLFTREKLQETIYFLICNV